jgi:glycosyltransferase involved in cell wall biosynthesis
MRLIARLNVGGPSIQTITLTRRLRERGYHTMLVRGLEGPDEGNMDHLADKLGVRPLRLTRLRRDLGPHDASALLAVLRLMRRMRPDILHTHAAKAGALGRAAALLAGDARPRVTVHTFHGHVFTGVFENERLVPLFVQIERFLARRTTRIVAVSQEVRQDLIDLRIAEPDHIEVIPLGFDLTPFALEGASRAEMRSVFRRRHGIGEQATLVTLLARVVQMKRVDRFLRIIDLLADLKDTVFLIAGDGDQRKRLQQSELARKHADRIVWAGFEHDIPQVCFGSDVVVLTSDNEGTPVALIEAQAAGVPVVSTKVGGVGSVVADGVGGLLLAAEDEEGFAEAVRSLALQPEVARSMGARGREHVLARFSIERLVDDIDGLYQRLLAEIPSLPPR